ncbi:MAG: PIN domain-containing protein [Oscillospiraceae bacterium]|jgi:tRNA(fMet)-specific endonuclease VapC|nr:PIN domain-containing protein [Oscillospiraceae bacterium]
MTYALDSNAVFQILNDNQSVLSNADSVIENGNAVVLPPFVYYEVQRGFFYKSSPVKELAFERLCELYPVGNMTLDVWDYAAQVYANLRKRNQTIEDADILIAAFCITNGYILVTHNTKHFERVSELVIEDWTIHN